MCVCVLRLAAGVSRPAAGGLCRPRHPHHASEALPDASHVHHGVAHLLQTGPPPPTVAAIGNNTTLVTCLCSPCVCSHIPSLNNVCRQLFGWIGEKLKHQAVVIVIMALMAVQGVANLQAQWAIIGEFSNLPQEELLDWIQENTQPGGWRRLTGEVNERSLWFIHSPCACVCVHRFSVCGGDAHHGQCEALHRTSHRQSPPLRGRWAEVGGAPPAHRPKPTAVKPLPLNHCPNSQ